MPTASTSSPLSVGRNRTPSPPPVFTSAIGHPSARSSRTMAATRRAASSTIGIDSVMYR